MKNIERVWKAEQKHEAERKKIEELQKQLKEERAREEMTKYAEETGVLKWVISCVMRNDKLMVQRGTLCLRYAVLYWMVTEKKMIGWTGCTRALPVRCPGMSTCLGAPLTSRSLTSMRSQRAVPQLRQASCLGPYLTPPPLPPASIWLPRSGKTPCLKSGEWTCHSLLICSEDIVKFADDHVCVLLVL